MNGQSNGWSSRCNVLESEHGWWKYKLHIKDLIKNENCIQVHAFNTRTLKLSNEVCVLRFAHTSVHRAKDYQ